MRTGQEWIQDFFRRGGGKIGGADKKNWGGGQIVSRAMAAGILLLIRFSTLNITSRTHEIVCLVFVWGVRLTETHYIHSSFMIPSRRSNLAEAGPIVQTIPENQTTCGWKVSPHKCSNWVTFSICDLCSISSHLFKNYCFFHWLFQGKYQVVSSCLNVTIK
jgi:hypothetical protein